MVYPWFDTTGIKSFTFSFTAGPKVNFNFDRVLPPVEEANRPFKRRRPLWDVDGSSCVGKKKRRLRLNLITSRLSRPFSAPATNIVDRGLLRIAPWTKGRRYDKNVLRKIAIMNRVRKRLDTAKMVEKCNTTRAVASPWQLPYIKRTSCDLPLPPTVLGLSDYDALDLDDEVFENDQKGGGGSSNVYSDFNFMDPIRTIDNDIDYLDELDGIPSACITSQQGNLQPNGHSRDRVVEEGLD